MKITFIRPNLSDRRSADAMEPLVFAILARLTPADIDITFYDERVEPLDLRDTPDLVALTVETYTARRAYQISTSYKERGVPVVMGGYHPSLLPEEAAKFADALIIGDAEELWPQLIADFRKGNLQKVYRNENPPAIENVLGDYSLFKGKRYGKIKPVYAGRGCKYACDFCSINAFYGNSVRQRPLNDVIAEVESFKSKLFFLIDDNLFVDLQRTTALLNALIPLKIHWVCQTSIEIAQNKELMDLLARSGCIAATIGFESLNRENLKQMNKASNLHQHDYTSTIQQFYDRGIMIYGTFVFGYDHDTRDSFEPVVDFAIESKFCLANFNPLLPTPGTRLYKRLESAGRLLYKQWWLDHNYRYGSATFKPALMSPDDLTNGCFQARKDFNSYSSIFSRTFRLKANSGSVRNIACCLIANFINKKEVMVKQNSCLGAQYPLISTE
ncbi:MAG: B12-binding domain-containing radical SAM protein [Desulfobulbaceae bacterium]|nr:B12-binding domain-containing radical SAM protein [Desulfobulbaceae bacterium]